jgi:hypothetical protein
MRGGTLTTIPRRANVTLIRQELMDKYGYTYDAANDVLYYTADHWRTNGHKASEWKVPDSEGFITVRYHELSRFTVEDHREISPKTLDGRRRIGYNRGSKGLPDHISQEQRRDKHMPPAARGRRSASRPAPAPEPEPEQNGEVDFQRYLDKDLTPTMQDYVEWFEDNVATLEDVPLDKLLTLGIYTYSYFQKSDFNIQRREARRASRAPAPEPEPEPAKPAGRGRPRGRAAAPAPEPEPEPAPAPARRGRGRAAARAGAEAPY